MSLSLWFVWHIAGILVLQFIASSVVFSFVRATVPRKVRTMALENNWNEDDDDDDDDEDGQESSD